MTGDYNMDQCDIEEEDEEEWQQIIDTSSYLSDEIHINTFETFSDDIDEEIPHQHDEEATISSSSKDNTVTRMSLNDHKAGMEGLDKDKINRIIHDASKGSKYYENEKRKEQKVMERIEAMKEELRHFTDGEKKKALVESNKVINDLAKRIDLSRTLVHVDMDAFYAAVEIRDNPILKDVPMAVGSSAMLSTSNYAARKYGVRAAMPGFIAKKLCPELVIVSSHFDKYRAVSADVREIFKEYDANYLSVSLDEAYLDLTDYMSENFMKYNYEDESKDLIEIIVHEIRRKIVDKTQLTASAGIGPNMMLAKICSDINKPNGQYYLKPNADQIKTFMKDLPIRKISGIGRVSEQMLKGINVEKCSDLLEKRTTLYLLFSDTSFRYFMHVALGRSSNRITHEERKSMSAERTFQDLSDTEKLLEICYDLSKSVEEDLTKENLKGYNVTLKYKLSSFVTKTRSKTVNYPVSKCDELYKIAKELLLKEIQCCYPDKFELRLMGVRVSNFEMKTNRKQHTLDSLFSNKIYSKVTKEKENITVLPSETDSKIIVVSEAPVNRNISIERDVINDSVGTFDVGMYDHGLVECPVCGQPQKNEEITLNSHIDNCLTKQTIKEIISEQQTNDSKSISEKQTNMVEVKSNKNDENNTNKRSGCNNSQKRKNIELLSTGKKKITLHNFWEKK